MRSALKPEAANQAAKRAGGNINVRFYEKGKVVSQSTFKLRLLLCLVRTLLIVGVWVCVCVCLVWVLFLPFLFLAFLASFFPFPCFPFPSWLHGVKLTAALFVPLLLSPLPGSQSLSPLTSRHKASDTPLPFGLLVSTFFFLFVFVCSLSLLLFVRALCCLLSFAVFFFLPFFLPRSNALHATCNVPSNEVKTKCCHPCTSMPTVTLCLASATSC